MKHITRLFAGTLLAGLLLAAPASAKAGDIIDYARYTDIAVSIDQRPIRSYNVQDRTAIVAEDLRGYGCTVAWSEENRTLWIEWAGTPPADTQYPELPPSQGQVGQRAKAIIETDIVTYLAGRQIDSFNIDGETVIWLSDLAVFGEVNWDEAARTASLQTGDPYALAMASLIDPLKAAWEDGFSGEYKLYESTYGTVFYATQSGSGFGSYDTLCLVYPNGTVYDLFDQFPPYGMQNIHANPSDFAMSDDGALFTFTSNINSNVAGFQGAGRCTLDVKTGKLVIRCSDNQWWADIKTESASAKQNVAFTVVLSKEDGLITVQADGSQGAFQSIHLTQDHCQFIVNMSSNILFKQLEEIGLNGRPVYLEDAKNTQEQRQQVANYIQLITPEGNVVSGEYHWGALAGPDQVSLWFTFDQPLIFQDGQQVTLRVGQFA